MFALRLLSEEGPNMELAYLLWWVLGFFFLMVVIGWLVSRSKKPTGESMRVEPMHDEHKHEDDLKMIEGIGPKVVQVLKEAGVASFEALAHADAAKLTKTLDAAGLQMMNPEGWIAQAKLAAKGDMAALKKMQDEMKGGRLKS